MGGRIAYYYRLAVGYLFPAAGGGKINANYIQFPI